MSKTAVRDCFARLAAVTLTTAALLGGCTHIDNAAVTPTPRAVRSPVRQAPPAPRPPRMAERTHELGTSVEGAPLLLHVFGNGADRMLIFGGIHGDEPTSAHVARELVEYLRQHPDIADGRTVAVLPAANPDGLRRGRRTNARGVDLNRNFPAGNWTRGASRRSAGGASPGSEPETQAIQRAVQLVQPTRVVSVHCIRGRRQCNNYDGPARDLAELMAVFNRYPVKASIGYPTPGSFGSWAGKDQEIPTITLELPRAIGADEAWQINREALLAFIRGGVTGYGGSPHAK